MYISTKYFLPDESKQDTLINFDNVIQIIPFDKLDLNCKSIIEFTDYKRMIIDMIFSRINFTNFILIKSIGAFIYPVSMINKKHISFISEDTSNNSKIIDILYDPRLKEDYNKILYDLKDKNYPFTVIFLTNNNIVISDDPLIVIQNKINN